MFVADFETCDAEEIYKVDLKTGMEIKNQRVWLAGFKNLETMKSTYFTNIGDFMDAVLARGSNQNSEYAFHNLKFDGSFIVPYLMNDLNYICVTDRKAQPGEFNILVDDRNSWYSITIQVTKRRKVLLWDSLKLFPTALQYLPDIYSTPTRKIREDKEFYERVRPVGYVPDSREMEYFENDLQVPAETINKHIELYGLRFKKTQASQSFYNFEQSFKAWKWRFNPLTTEQDAAIRAAYWGGVAYVSTRKAGVDQYNIGVFDINSSYPDKAANFKLPYGEVLYEFGEGKHPDMSKFWVAEALVEFKLKENCLPCIPSRSISEGRPLETEKWMDDSEGIVRMTFSAIDYITIQESYETFKIYRWCWSMHWAWKKHREVAKFVNTNNDIKVKYSKLAKQETDKQKKAEFSTMRNRAKIDNNSFYGKFGEEILKKGKTPYAEDDDIIWRVDREDETPITRRKFLPVAIAITAWGRQQLVKGWNVLGEHAIYCDTDSLHYLLEGQHKIDTAAAAGQFEVDEEKLGAWKHEGNFQRGRYLRAKCYMEEKANGEIEATVAGLPADPNTGQFSKKRSCLTWENFHIGHHVPSNQSNRLRTVHTPTGNKLVPTHFQIREKESLFGL